MASQIARSDWTDTTGRATQRFRFTLGGAALGFVAGIFLGTRGGGVAMAPPPLGPPRLPRPANAPITATEIRNSSARSLLELLRELRPQWLRAEGTRVLLPSGAEPAAKGGVRVYVNGAPIGGLETLDEVSIDAVTEIQFMNGQAAALRYGAGAADGVILVTAAAAP